MAEKAPLVGVVMGSQSDLETMERCLKQLDELGVSYEVRVISAHRTPDVAHEYSQNAAQRGIKVIIAAAGMSAALAGGVPINSGPLNGVDAALSTMQMPLGVPVGCMAVGKTGATNAAIFAAQVLAGSDPKLDEKLAELKSEQAQEVFQADQQVSKRS